MLNAEQPRKQPTPQLVGGARRVPEGLAVVNVRRWQLSPSRSLAGNVGLSRPEINASQSFA